VKKLTGASYDRAKVSVLCKKFRWPHFPITLTFASCLLRTSLSWRSIQRNTHCLLRLCLNTRL
jgi:hypothetical protein